MNICVKIIIEELEVYMISSYFQYKDELDIRIQAWERCINKFHKERIVLAGVVNTKSILWHNNNADYKGEELEAFIEANDLDVCNRES